MILAVIKSPEILSLLHRLLVMCEIFSVLGILGAISYFVNAIYRDSRLVSFLSICDWSLTQKLVHKSCKVYREIVGVIQLIVTLVFMLSICNTIFKYNNFRAIDVIDSISRSRITLLDIVMYVGLSVTPILLVEVQRYIEFRYQDKTVVCYAGAGSYIGWARIRYTEVPVPSGDQQYMETPIDTVLYAKGNANGKVRWKITGRDYYTTSGIGYNLELADKLVYQLIGNR